MSVLDFLFAKQPTGTLYYRLWSWGLNSSGQLGDGTTSNRSSPVSVVGGVTDWTQVSAGPVYTAAIRSDGTLWAWGSNGFGQLGDGTTTSRLSPVSVVGGFTDWIQVSVGNTHTLGIRSDGTLWAWGRNNSGKLGDGTTTSRLSPVSVVGGFTDWIQVSAGTDHTLGIRSDGTAWAWGDNASGQLGTNNTSNRSSPVSVISMVGPSWIQVSAGSNYSTGIMESGPAYPGVLWAWGNNSSGRLGTNNISNRSSPVTVVGGFTDWIQVSAGYGNTSGIRSDGTLWAWGDNSSGQLGTNNISSRSSPVTVVGGFTDWIQVSNVNTLTTYSTGLRSDGTLWAWGSNSQGQLGDGTTTSRSSPVSVVGGFTNWTQVSNGVGLLIQQ